MEGMEAPQIEQAIQLSRPDDVVNGKELNGYVAEYIYLADPGAVASANKRAPIPRHTFSPADKAHTMSQDPPVEAAPKVQTDGKGDRQEAHRTEGSEGANLESFASNKAVLENAKSSGSPRPDETAKPVKSAEPEAPAPEASEPDAAPSADAEMVDAPPAEAPVEGTNGTAASPSADKSEAAKAESKAEDSAAESRGDVDMTAPKETAEPSGPSGAAAPKTDAEKGAEMDVQDASVSQLAIDGPESPLDTQGDTVMADSTASLSKESRQREDDEEALPSAKRVKTAPEGAAESPAPAIVESPAAIPNGIPSYEDPEADPKPITQQQNVGLRKILAGIKKTKAGGVFRDSVEKLWPTVWESYAAKIESPVDIGLLERRLRENKYESLGEFKADVLLLYKNSLTFNGPDHIVTTQAMQVVDQIMTRLPEALSEAKPGSTREAKAPTRHTEPRAAATAAAAATTTQQQPRRQSRGAATSPTAKVSDSPVFAIPPSGIPIIRRDSSKNDSDRPKRPIHPPKNKDLEYGQKNMKKKLPPELRFCEHVLEEMKKGKYYSINAAFLEEVDVVALGIPNYFDIIKKPMDLSKITSKLYNGEYQTPKDFQSDVNLMFRNCYKFNPPEDPVHQQALQLEQLFKTKWAEKDAWLAKNAPPPPPTPVQTEDAASEAESDEEGSDAEAEEEASSSPVIDSLMAKLQEEEAKIKEMLMSPKPDLMLLEVQQQMINMIQRQIVMQRIKLNEEKESKPKKAKAPKAAKPKASGGAAGGKKAAAKDSAKKAGGSSKKAKPRVIGQLEKNIIASSINDLDPESLTKAVEIIQKDTNQSVSWPAASFGVVAGAPLCHGLALTDFPLQENDSGEMELDIDQLSADALGKLYDLVSKALPELVKELRAKAQPPPPAVEPLGPAAAGAAKAKSQPKVPKPKKNKPMNKLEQERKIEQLRELKAQFSRGGSGSQEPLPSVEDSAAADAAGTSTVAQAESSEEDESDSEEE